MVISSPNSWWRSIYNYNNVLPSQEETVPSIASRQKIPPLSQCFIVKACQSLSQASPKDTYTTLHPLKLLVTTFSIMTHWTQFPQHLPLPSDFTWTQRGLPCFHVKHGIQSLKTSHTEPSSTLEAWGLLFLEKAGGRLWCLCETLFTNKPLEI